MKVPALAGKEPITATNKNNLKIFQTIFYIPYIIVE
jgi:hypothetical protein